MSTQPEIKKRIKKFEYFWPETVEEVFPILQEFGGKAKVLAGGTDILPMMKLRVLQPDYIISLRKIPELDYIVTENGVLRIGAMTPISTLLDSDVINRNCYSLHDALKVFGTPQIRNMATIGGNICRSSPSSDTVPPLMSFSSMVKLIGEKEERILPLVDFFTGSGKNELNDEILAEIIVPISESQNHTSFIKITRNSSDLAKVNCAVKITLKAGKRRDIKIVLGAVADRAIRAKNVESVLKGSEITDELVGRASQNVVRDIDPISDVRSTTEYRSHVSQIIVKRGVMRAIKRT